jgi:hypothetical protein
LYAFTSTKDRNIFSAGEAFSLESAQKARQPIDFSLFLG